ncbi:MAG: acyltransferase [Chloroflexi bacterium]|nr:acyltransferase [Chloroflexota bacterium]
MNEVPIKKYDHIDALRGFAILGVVLIHSSQWVTPALDTYTMIANQGARGVQLFYMASALTLFLSMDSRREHEKRPLLSFFIRRFFRIAPLFYLAILVYTLYSGTDARFAAPNGIAWWFIPLTALFLHGWHPETINSVVPGGWSIAVEMTFYLFVPFLFKKLTGVKSTLAVLLGSLLLSSLLSVVVARLLQPLYPEDQQHLVDSFLNLWFFSQLPVFLLGILLYHLTKQYPDRDRVMGLLFLLISLYLFTAFLKTNTFKDLLPQHFLYGIAFLFFSLSLHFWPSALLVNKVTTLIGRLSFGIYLAHFMVIKLMRTVFFKDGFILNGNKGALLAYLLVLAASMGISYIAHNLIEVPGINWGRRIIKGFS